MTLWQYVIVIAIIGGTGILAAWFLRGDPEPGEESYKSRTLDILAVIAAIVIVGITMSSLARAGEVGLLSGGVRVGLMHEMQGYTHFCQKDGGIEGVYGEPEAFIDVYRDGPVTATLSYRHASCAYGPDSYSSDRVGIVLEYRVW